MLTVIATTAMVVVATCGTMSHSKPAPNTVTEMLRGIATRPFPVEESTISELVPRSEQRNVKTVQQGAEHDVQWSSSDDSCFVTFMVEAGYVAHIWGRCSGKSRTDAVALFKSWTSALSPQGVDRLPSPDEPFVHTFIGTNKETALDLSLQNQDGCWLVGFGLRSGVPRAALE